MNVIVNTTRGPLRFASSGESIAEIPAPHVLASRAKITAKDSYYVVIDKCKLCAVMAFKDTHYGHYHMITASVSLGYVPSGNGYETFTGRFEEIVRTPERWRYATREDFDTFRVHFGTAYKET